MTDRRYSIIPARAVTDARLDRRALQVLCFLGTYTNKLGWCFLRQGEIAKALNCGRSTIQRALTQLIDASWVQTKDFTGPRPHACHAYRVIMDTDDQELHPSGYEVDGSEEVSRCPPVGTSSKRCPINEAPRAARCITGEAPKPEKRPEVPTYAWAHKDQEEGSGSSGSARARGFSDEALKVSNDLAVIAGHDLAFLPPRWMSDGPVMRVQMMLDHGWASEMMLETARAMMARKNDGPPVTIKYFERAFARSHALQSQQSPLPTAPNNPSTAEKPNAQQTQNAHDWKSRRDRGHSALGRFGQALADAEDDQCGSASAPIVQDGVPSGRG